MSIEITLCFIARNPLWIWLLASCDLKVKSKSIYLVPWTLAGLEHSAGQISARLGTVGRL